MERVRKTDRGYDVYTESALARLASRYESSARIEQITRTSSSPVKEPKGWRDQFMCMISTRRQNQLHRRDYRSRSVVKERRSKASNNNGSGHSCTVPRLRSLSTIEEHLNRQQIYASPKAAKEKLAKQKKLRPSDRSNNSRKPRRLSSKIEIPRFFGECPHWEAESSDAFSGPKKKRERMMSFQLDSMLPAPYYMAAQNEINPTCRPSVLEGLVLKGALSLVRFSLFDLGMLFSL